MKFFANESQFRVQRFALKLGRARVLVRHRHAPSDGAGYRHELNSILATEPSGNLTIDVGDFNKLLLVTANSTWIFPSLNTFRLNTNTDNCISFIDGVVATQFLGHRS